MANIIEKLNEISNENERKTSLIKLTWVWGSCIVLFFAITLLFPLPSTDPLATEPEWLAVFPNDIVKGLIKEARAALAGSLATFALFGVGFQLIFGPESTKKIEEGLTRIIFGNRKLIDSFDLVTKELFVRNSLRSVLGSDTGDAIFSGVVHPLMAAGKRFRRLYNYDVTLLNQDEFPSSKELGVIEHLFPNAIYRWIEEDVGYQSFNPHNGQVNYGPFYILLLFDKATLTSAFSDDRIYFRSLIEMDRQNRDLFFQQSDDEIKKFVRTAMRFRAKESIGNANKNYDIEVLRNEIFDTSGESQPAIKVRVDEIRPTERNKLKVNLRYPHHRDVTEFTISLPQPTQGADFSIHGASDINRLEPIYYVTSSSADPIEENRPNRTIKVALRGWVFPTSGVTFTWKNAANATSK
jgi:hypothetical protein